MNAKKHRASTREADARIPCAVFGNYFVYFCFVYFYFVYFCFVYFLAG